MRRARPLLLIALAALGFPSAVRAQAPPPPTVGRTHGINLGPGVMSYDNACLIFADLIKASGSFNGYRGVAPSPEYDAGGWPTRVDAKTGSTSLVVALNANLPAGAYTLTAKGVGKVRFSGGFDGQNWREVAFNGDGKPRTVKLAKAGVPWGSQIQFEITESRPNNPLRDISFVLPGHVGKTFFKGYLEDLRPFSVLRTMDWQTTNGSKLVEWKDREKSTKFSYFGRGRIGEEVACELANLLHKDLWICIPGLASDDYVRQLAGLVDRLLDRSLTLYVEFSNEVWNDSMPQFQQFLKAREKDTQGLGGWEWIARRDGRLVNLFKDSLPGPRKCVRVLARQAAYPHTLTVAINQYKADGRGFDAISCAAYFVTKTEIGRAGVLYKKDPTAAVTKVLDGLDASIGEIAKQVAWYQSQADANKVPLILYEAGEHLANWQEDTLTPMMTAVNRDPRMGVAYARMIAALPAAVGPICWYYDCGTYSKWGYWGLKEHTGQSLKAAHKYRAVIETAKPKPAPVAATR